MNVTLEDAYAEACKALGESVVRERLLTGEAVRLTKERDELVGALNREGAAVPLHPDAT